MRARPLESPATALDDAVAKASPFATGPLTAISWPTDQKPEWKISYKRQGGPAEVTVADGSGLATKPKPHKAKAAPQPKPKK